MTTPLPEWLDEHPGPDEFEAFWINHIGETLSILREQHAEIERLEQALINAIEGMQDMVPYVPVYFRKKWAHDAYIERAIQALDDAATERSGE